VPGSRRALAAPAGGAGTPAPARWLIVGVPIVLVVLLVWQSVWTGGSQSPATIGFATTLETVMSRLVFTRLAALALRAPLPRLAMFAPLKARAATAATAAPATPGITGEVLETRNVDNYTYLRLRTAEGELWAAVLTTPTRKGERVTIVNPMTMTNFESKSLKRTFDRIVVGTLADQNAKVAAAPAPAAPLAPGGLPPAGAMAAAPAGAPNPHAPAPGAPTTPTAKVAKAAGADARTVAEVVDGRTALSGRTVLVHARVVKANSGIMGKNWLHLQDGSGSAADGTNDIVVTTKNEAAIGDIVTARGKVRTDVDVGSGYTFAALIEDATVTK